MAGTRVGVDQRALIVRAAHRAVAEKGRAGLRVRAVAQDAGITHATLHHYFPTKADLVRAVIDLAIHEGIARPLVEEAEPVRPLEELRRLLHGLLDRSGDDEGSAVMLELLRHGHAEDVIEPLRRYTETWRGYLVELLRRAVARLGRHDAAVVVGVAVRERGRGDPPVLRDVAGAPDGRADVQDAAVLESRQPVADAGHAGGPGGCLLRTGLPDARVPGEWPCPTRRRRTCGRAGCRR